jgi:hypothetical protein
MPHAQAAAQVTVGLQSGVFPATMEHKRTERILTALLARVVDDRLQSRLVYDLLLDCHKYINARIEDQLSYRIHTSETLGPSDLKEQKATTDAKRRISHNALISDLSAVDRLCLKIGLEPLYGDDYQDREKTARFARMILDITAQDLWMKDLLNTILGAGLPAYAALALTIFSVFLWRYFEHRLEIERSRSAKELELLHAAYQDKFRSVDVIFSHLAELVHNVRGYPDENIRQTKIHKECQFLRHFVREKQFVLGRGLQQPVYALTDYAKAIVEGASTFNESKLYGLSEDVHTALRKVSDSIPQVKKIIN